MLYFPDNINYLDPGSGALLFQILAAAALSIGIYFRNILNFIKSKLTKKRK
tara:strand:+ start:116 stop:268 length:153 start_codon:yes stop_codon:yes gene_type:complete